MKRTVTEARRALLERVQTEGIEAAYDAALAVCRDPKAPAPARATASATLFRVAGLFERREDGGRPKEPFEMSIDEITEEIRRLEHRAAQKPPSIFE